MDNSVEVSPIEKYSGIVLQAIEEVYPQQTSGDKFRQRVLSGDPDAPNGGCGYCGSKAVAKKLSQELMASVRCVASGDRDVDLPGGHMYLLLEEKQTETIIDAVAGQFIPLSSRVGYEKYFKGNMFIGPRKVLKEIASQGVTHTITASDPVLSFRRIWGDKSYEK